MDGNVLISLSLLWMFTAAFGYPEQICTYLSLEGFYFKIFFVGKSNTEKEVELLV